MAQTLETIIAINATVGNGFSAVGSTLTQLGSMVNGLSQELINFGKDSVNIYREYEKSMKDAEVALSTTYGRGTKELSSVMAQLDVSATEWAATTIFHTNDVANAISEMAHAGWDGEKILSAMPAAMELAQAGSLDLSEAVNYIVKSTNSLGIDSVDDIGNFIDIWAFAANSSASTIGEFGDAMLRMGSTMRFASNPEELMTLIAVTANAGQTGSEAGTLIRNSMMRLVAPTKKAKEAMAELGATSDEAAVLMNDSALAAANARLEAAGFSAFDEKKGELKSVLDIYRELYLSLGEVAGGFDNIEKNQDALEILGSIFPTRTITEALTLLRGAAEGYDGLYEAMMGGDAADYGQYAAETMMNSLDGKIETFESKVERLKQAVGEELAPQLESALEGIGGIVDSIAGMDEGSFSALVSGLEVIAGAGPALLLAGGAFRLIGYALTPAGGIGLGLVALTAAAAAIKQLEEADFAKAFGTAEIDHSAIQSYVQGLSTDFKNAYTEVNNFKTALDESVTSYSTASETFSSSLLTDMLTGATLSEEDITKLQNLGKDMHQSVIDGIENSTAGSMSYWNMLFGGSGQAENDENYLDIIDLENTSYQEALAQAEQIGQGLRDAMTSAFADGQISEEEYNNILNYVRSYNEAMARAAAEAKSEEDYINQQMLFHKAETASLDEIKDVAKEIQTERDNVLKEAEEEYLKERYGLEYKYDQAIANGTEINGVRATEAGKRAALAAVDEKYNQHVLDQGEKYDDILYKLWDSQIQQSDYADAYKQLGDYADRVMSGELTAESAVSMFKDLYGNNALAGEADLGGDNTRTRLGNLLARQMAGYGGVEGIEQRILDYESKGDTAHADALRRLYTMQQINDNFAQTGVQDYQGIMKSLFGEDTVYSTSQGEYAPYQMNRGRYNEFMAGYGDSTYSVQNARNTTQALGEGTGTIYDLFHTIKQELNGENPLGAELFQALNGMSKTAQTEFQNMYSNLAQNYDLERVIADTKQYMPYDGAWADTGSAMREPWAMYQLMYGQASVNAEDYRIKVTPEVDTSTIPNNLDPIPLPIEPKVEGTSAAEQLAAQGVTVDVGADTQSLEATIDGADGQTLMEYVDGDATNLSMKITDQDGKTLTENVTGNASSLAAIINSYNGRTITVNIKGNKMFASGGRATTASIFGEAGPEWAIPEEHSSRTASLLNQARAASGFSWQELLSMYGGLNAGGGNSPTTLIYSPTIQAADASGVEQVLLDDKKRLEKWWNDKQMRDEVEVYT